jgi:alkylation response protein AidB-like acyl-CoA dehydrogenase
MMLVMDRELLARAAVLAETVLRPGAAAADRAENPGILERNIRQLGDAGFFGLAISREYGGLDADEATRHEYAEILASACGVTAFTQQQFQTGVKFLMDSANTPLKRALLPECAAGRLHCGVAISHLRRSGTPMLRAEEAPGGYRLHGTIPWITGWTLLDGFVLGAVRADGQHLLAYVDRAQHQEALTASAPMDLCVMAASDTVEVRVTDLHIAEDCVLACQPPEALTHYELRMLTSHAALPLGCARAAAQILHEIGRRPGRDDTTHTAMGLTLEIHACRRQALTWHCDCIRHPDYTQYAMRARTSAITLAMRAAFAAVTASGGRAHLRDAAPQRLLREAQFYATAVQTPEIQAGVLDQLVSPFFGQ